MIVSRTGYFGWLGAVILAAAGLAVVFRASRLDLRPMHQDEAVHAVKTGELIDQGVYRYDPYEFHGPTLYYLSLPGVWLGGARDFAGTTAVMLRAVPVFFGVALILLFLLTADGLGKTAAGVAAILLAVSPAMVFYSRYYIQEILLVFFTYGAIAAGWRFARSGSWTWALVAGACLGLMQATKETCLIAYGAISAALVATALWGKWREGSWPARPPRAASWRMATGLAAGLAASALFFSSFFTHPKGVADAFLAYANYFLRSQSGGLHDHPWDYYLRMLIYTRGGPGLWWSEGLIVGLAVVGFLAALAGREGPAAGLGLPRFLAFYTLFLTAAYSAVPYKTPWCMLGFLHSMIALAGFGAAALIRAIRGEAFQGIAWVLLGVGAAHLGVQNHRANFVYPADPRNPYVYAHTSTDFPRMTRQIEEIAALTPEGYATRIHVITPDYWPLPWQLRRFTRVGYWDEPPNAPDAPLLVTSLEMQARLDPLLHDAYVTSVFGLRPHVLIALYVRSDLWDAYMAWKAGSSANRE